LSARVLVGLLLWGLTATAADPPQRIISTAPSLTEILFALDLGDRVAGVTTYCFYPPEARRKPKIGTYLKPDLETLLHLQPDLIVAMEQYTDLRQQLAPYHLPLLEVSNETLAAIRDSMLAIGRAAGVEARARTRVAALDKELDDVRRRVSGLPRRRVMFVVGRTPETVSDLVVVGGGNFLNELLSIAGGENIFAGAVVAYPKVPAEEMLARRPEVIIDRGDVADPEQAPAGHDQAVVRLWNRWSQLPAVTSRRVYPVASEIYVIPGPRVGEAARALGRLIHPEAAW
jgi:iron complex transport system substrate-binding protein